MMRKIPFALVVAMLVAAPAVAETARPEKTTRCETEATQKALTGEARKAFMDRCAPADQGALTAEQRKTQDCTASADTQHLQGESRREFLSACLAH